MRFSRGRTKVGALMEQRLGKTLSLHRWMDSMLRNGEPRLVLTNASVVHEWASSLERDGHEPVMLLGPTAKKEEELAAALELGKTWFVSNHETVYSSVARFPWHGAIIDESTFIKNPKSKAFRAACRAFGQVPVRAIASGLPNPEDPEMDLVAQMIWLKGSCMGCRSYWEWRAKYAVCAGYSWIVGGKAAAALKREVEDCCFVLTRREAGVECKKDRSKRFVQLPRVVKEEIARARREFAVGGRLVSNVLPCLGYEAKLAGGFLHDDPELKKFSHEAKAREVVRIVSRDFPRKQVVVWARHNAEVVGMARILESVGPTTYVIGEGMPPAERRDRVTKFQAGKFRYLVAQPRCLQKGVNLAAADVAVVVSNYYDHEIRAQLEDRIVQVGKERVDIIDVVAEGTVDERAAELIHDKRVSSAVFFSRMLDMLKRGAA